MQALAITMRPRKRDRMVSILFYLLAAFMLAGLIYLEMGLAEYRSALTPTPLRPQAGNLEKTVAGVAHALTAVFGALGIMILGGMVLVGELGCGLCLGLLALRARRLRRWQRRLGGALAVAGPILTILALQFASCSRGLW